MQDNRPESIEGLSQTELDRLVAENAKWRERVPRLAAALQARTEELDQLKANGQSPSDLAEPLTGTRQALVEEIQAELQQAKERYQKSEGEGKSREIQIEDLASEVTSWKSKWSELANSLDASEKELRTLNTQLQEAEDDCVSLKTRNEDVLQTAEMAHQEVEVLVQDKLQLQTALDNRSGQFDELENKLSDQHTALELVQQEVADKLKAFQDQEQAGKEIDLQLVDAKETLAKREQRVEDLDRKIEEQDAMLCRFRDAADVADVREKEQAEEIAAGSEYREKSQLLEEKNKALEAELSELQQSLTMATGNETALSEQVTALDRSKQELETELQESRREQGQVAESLNVMAAEADSKAALMADLEMRLKSKSQQVDSVQEELEKLQAKETEADASLKLVSDSEHKAAEVMLQEKDKLIEELEEQNRQAESKNLRCLETIEQERDNYAQRADDLEALLLEVESENNQLTTKLTDASRVNPEEQPKVDKLMADIRRLEESLRDRAKELNDVEWKSTVDNNKQDQTLIVLNQQLEDAREENRRLVAKLRESDVPNSAPEVLEAPVLGEEPSPDLSAHDDLTQIKGIGPKLASQLNELGVYRLEQIAGLEAVEIEDDHLLHPFKARINRDDWVGQALQITS